MGRTERENGADKKREGKKEFCSRDDCFSCRISNIGGCHTNNYAVIFNRVLDWYSRKQYHENAEGARLEMVYFPIRQQ